MLLNKSLIRLYFFTLAALALTAFLYTFGPIALSEMRQRYSRVPVEVSPAHPLAKKLEAEAKGAVE